MLKRHFDGVVQWFQSHLNEGITAYSKQPNEKQEDIVQNKKNWYQYGAMYRSQPNPFPCPVLFFIDFFKL